MPCFWIGFCARRLTNRAMSVLFVTFITAACVMPLLACVSEDMARVVAWQISGQQCAIVSLLPAEHGAAEGGEL